MPDIFIKNALFKEIVDKCHFWYSDFPEMA